MTAAAGLEEGKAAAGLVAETEAMGWEEDLVEDSAVAGMAEVTAVVGSEEGKVEVGLAAVRGVAGSAAADSAVEG